MEKFIVTECPTCRGERRILITDYVDYSLKYDWPIRCPVCAGDGSCTASRKCLGH